MSFVTDIRDEVYLRIGIKQTAELFSFANNFILQKTWKPWVELEDILDPAQFPSGKVYVIGGKPGDINSLSRSNMVLREYPVMVGFQHAVDDVEDTAEIDAYVGFVQELEDVCRLDIEPEMSNGWAFSRVEYLRDPNEQPLSYVMLRQASMFEAYFTAFYSIAHEGYTTTTTT